jgi:putative transposase
MRSILRDRAYAFYYNRKYRLNGHLWQDRFYSCVLDETHWGAAIRYVECNPVRAKLASKAEAYPWSSAPARCGIQANAWLMPLSLPIENKVWSEWLREEDDEGNRLLRRHTQTGRSYGCDSFLDNLEHQSR